MRSSRAWARIQVAGTPRSSAAWWASRSGVGPPAGELVWDDDISAGRHGRGVANARFSRRAFVIEDRDDPAQDRRTIGAHATLEQRDHRDRALGALSELLLGETGRSPGGPEIDIAAALAVSVGRHARRIGAFGPR